MSFTQKLDPTSTLNETGFDSYEWNPTNIEERQREFLEKFREASEAGREDEMNRLIVFAEASIAERRKEKESLQQERTSLLKSCSLQGLTIV
ncbi:hypothetical protein NM208_g9416 [Fusarium decemcellulare]|uniref:Uncharacterized protein n=1 Tax=Fusarium decemcellulare TaxID=57161 RepID=A0ACC1S1T1_9HYPO|nr:hypothetical protein NM208_g9416 [Fusarium decemcellulare]